MNYVTPRMRRSASPNIRELATFTDLFGLPPDGDALHAIVNAVASRTMQDHSSSTRASHIQRHERLGGRAAVEAAIVTLDHLCARSANLRDC